MRIGVYAPRRSSFPIVGPPAMEAIKRGHEVTLLRDRYGEQDGDTWLELEARRDLPGISGVRAGASYSGDWLMGPAIDPRLVPHIKVASLEPWLDSLARPYSDVYDVTHRTLRHGLISTDAIAACPTAVKDQVVWFLPKTRVPGLFNRAMRYLTMLVTRRVLERTCLEHNLSLILKTRRKIRVPKALQHLAIVGEERLYPAPAIRLIASSRLVVCHHSAAAIEAAALSVPCLNVRVPIPHLRAYPQHALMTMRTNSPMAWPGVIQSAALLYFATHDLKSDFATNPVARQTYLDTWLGGKAQGASAWVLDRMEAA